MRCLGFVASVALLSGCGADARKPEPNATDAPFPMPNPPSFGLPNPQEYAVSEPDGVVRDAVTGLEWQQRVDTGPGEGGGFVWDQAALHCDELLLAGRDDWRLPSRIELVSLVDPSTLGPAVDTVAFPSTPPEAYWTSSPVVLDPDQAFFLNFFFGYTSTNFRVYAQSVRCVRNAQQPSLSGGDRYRAEGGSVRDRTTGLTWQESPPTSLIGFEAANAYCAELALDGSAPWRAPSMKELQTLVDETRSDILADPTAFPDMLAALYWTSTPLSGDPASGWLVRFSDGYSLDAATDTAALVRCVR